jgi:hypothetical protein
MNPRDRKILKEFNARENTRKAAYLAFLKGQVQKWEALQKKPKPKKSFWKWW